MDPRAGAKMETYHLVLRVGKGLVDGSLLVDVPPGWSGGVDDVIEVKAMLLRCLSFVRLLSMRQGLTFDTAMAVRWPLHKLDEKAVAYDNLSEEEQQRPVDLTVPPGWEVDEWGYWAEASGAVVPTTLLGWGERAGMWKLCNHCRAGRLSLQVCSGCRGKHYCSKECQEADWPSHKSECRSGAHASP